MAHREQLRRGRQVIVPQVVVYSLEVPEPLAGACVECEQRIAEQVRAVAVSAVEIVSRRAEREVRDAPFLIQRDLAPGVHPADVFPRVRRPGVVPELAGVRNGMKLPNQLTGADIVGAKVARRRHIHFAGGGAEDDQVFENAPRRAGLYFAHGLDIAAKTFAQIDAAVVSECVDGDARSCVEFLKVAVDREDQTAVGAILALPVVKAAIGRLSIVGVLHSWRPVAASSATMALSRADDVHHAVNDQRVEREAPRPDRAPGGTTRAPASPRCLDRSA